MSVSPLDNGESPIRPLDFASFLLSPEGVDAIRKAYTPPISIADSTTAHNRAIIQSALRLQAPAYVIPDHLFTTTQEQQLWKDSVIQSHARGMPAIRGRIPMSALQTWIQPATVVSATSTACTRLVIDCYAGLVSSIPRFSATSYLNRNILSIPSLGFSCTASPFFQTCDAD